MSIKYYMSTKSKIPKIRTEEQWRERDVRFYDAIGYNGKRTVSNQGQATQNPLPPKDAWERTVKLLGLQEISEEEVPRDSFGRLQLDTVRSVLDGCKYSWGL